MLARQRASEAGRQVSITRLPRRRAFSFGGMVRSYATLRVTTRALFDGLPAREATRPPTDRMVMAVWRSTHRSVQTFIRWSSDPTTRSISLKAHPFAVLEEVLLPR